MENLISTENLIKQAKKRGVNFGKGDPYNRLRYYTKMGWLPHMIRKKGERDDEVKGHYPAWAIDRLVLIEELKSKGYTNEEITDRLQTKNRLQAVYSAVDPNKLRTQIILLAIVGIIVLVLAAEAGVVNLGGPRTGTGGSNVAKVIIDDGQAFVPAGQRRVLVRSSQIQANSKVYLTFNTNYSPAQRYWVSQLLPRDGFIIELDAPVFEDSEFSWWVTN
jgi:hypothetical protein